MIETILIRSVKLDDAERLLEIYSYYVENTAISFEYVDIRVTRNIKSGFPITGNPDFLIVRDGHADNKSP